MSSMLLIARAQTQVTSNVNNFEKYFYFFFNILRMSRPYEMERMLERIPKEKKIKLAAATIEITERLIKKLEKYPGRIKNDNESNLKTKWSTRNRKNEKDRTKCWNINLIMEYKRTVLSIPDYINDRETSKNKGYWFNSSRQMRSLLSWITFGNTISL